MVAFHAYITSNFPMAAPLEWNVMMVYGGLFIFGGQRGGRPWASRSARVGDDGT
jgi:hypothetical protein